MNCLVTGGAGFIGRWVVRMLLQEAGRRVVVVDNYSNSRPENLAEFRGNAALTIIEGDVSQPKLLESLWARHGPFDLVLHLAAQIRVQDSIDDPYATFVSDVDGTMRVLEQCRCQYFAANDLKASERFDLLKVQNRLKVTSPRLVFMSTCMVYDRAPADRGIDENHPTRPASPYGAAKIAAENLVLSYHHAYRMPVKVIRPFNTYGPFQKRNMEGGVVAIFVARDLAGEPLFVKGEGTQTRDLLFVEDCARFVVQAGLSSAGDGEIMNAGLGRDITINDLAAVVADSKTGGRGVAVQHIPHDHPQAEIAKLLCDNRKAKRLLAWEPRVSLEEGIRRTRAWIRENPGAL